MGNENKERKFPWNGIAAFFDSHAKESPNFEIIYTIEVKKFRLASISIKI